MHMAAVGDLQGVQQALLSGIPPQMCDDFGRTALHEAAATGHVQILRALLEAGANPNAACHDGWTPLCEAAKCGQPQAIHVLLDHGARLDQPHPWSAYNAGLRAEADTATFQALLTGMAPDTLDKDGKPIIEAAIRKRRADVVAMLLRSGASTQINSEGKCPLIMFALRSSNDEIVSMLLDEVAGNVSQQTLADALSLACKRACESVGNPPVGIVQHLLSVGASPHLPDSRGSSLLRHACHSRQLWLLDLLIGEDEMPKEVYRWVTEGAFGAGHQPIFDEDWD